LSRTVHGPGEDDPLVWYEGVGLGDKRWYHADERGSMVGVSNASGVMVALNAYDEYGVPACAILPAFPLTTDRSRQVTN
jgi:hypothetical protein